MAERGHRINYVVKGHLAHSQAGPQSVNYTQIFIAGARGGFLG